MFSGTWPVEIPSSVEAEPAAVAALLPAALEGKELPDVVLVVTDHLPTAHASASAAPRAPSYNRLMLFLHKRFPNTRFFFAHILGHFNITDSLSRDGSAEGITLERVRNVAEMGWDFALSILETPKPCALCDSPVPWRC